VDEDIQGPVGARSNMDEAIIHDMIEVLPEPRGEPESEPEDSESEPEENESEDEFGKENGKENDEVDIYGEDDESTIPRAATVEPEIFESAPSSPLPQQVESESRPQCIRKPPPQPFDPGTYVSAQHESQTQSHVAWKADTTMWNESATIEPHSYEEAVNHPLYSKEWTAVIQEEYDSLMKNGAWELVDLP
jgi:hypothetical protein